MANFTRNFMAGRMNKTYDQRVIPDGEYIDAMNIRMASTEKDSAGVIENTDGNLPLTTIQYDGTPLSAYARCIGAIEDSARETIYWFVHDPQFVTSNTGKLDLIVSFNVVTQVLTYNIISMDDGGGVNTTLNFNPQYLITGVDMVEDLLFWTDNYNEPRFININRSYGNPDMAGIDGNGDPDLLYESILVIKRPPAEAPQLNLVNVIGEETFLEERFICFAYRYRYDDNQFSATSQWSEIAFLPSRFSYDQDSFLNEGMVNKFNGVEVSYNSGGPLVVGVDLLFKDSTSNIIKVIERLDKNVVGLLDNTTYTYFFNNSKIYTVLPESELLRLYDNVPRKAKAQTIMGNRLMYGNYIDGYNLIDKDGRPVYFDYYAELISKEINNIDVTSSLDDVEFTIDGSQIIPNAQLIVDLAGIPLIEGSLLTFTITIVHDSFSGLGPFPTETTGSTQINFSIDIQNTYNSVYAFATSQEFVDAIGTSLPGGNIQLVYNPIGDDSCDGLTFTDLFNCSLPTYLDALVKVDSGISAGGQAMLVTASPGSDEIKLTILAAKYVDNPTTPTQTVYEYYTIVGNVVQYSGIGVPKSLHSNRGYEVGVVYMDEYGRSTPANVSQFNNVFVPCSYSKNANSIRVTIPVTQVAPYWAKRYKFVCKADRDTYNTIYSSVYFEDPDSGDIFCLLEGENARKVEVGDRYIVKVDSSGPLDSCSYVTVLSKDVYASEFIEPDNGLKPPAGVYMKISGGSLFIDLGPGAYIETSGSGYSSDGNAGARIIVNAEGEDPLIPGSLYRDVPVRRGSVIKFLIEVLVRGSLVCGEKRSYSINKEFISKGDYNNIYDWFIGDNIEPLFVGESSGYVDINFISGIGSIPSPPYPGYDAYYDVVYRFNRLADNALTMDIIGVHACDVWVPFADSASRIGARFKFRSVSNQVLIFETESIDTVPDIFFENHLSFPIDADGNHLSNGAPNDQDQDIAIGQPAIIDTGFFNCFAFGNGAESYRVRDSISARFFILGERVTTVASRNYKETRRFSDITYSGVYNPFTNFNNLNVFNEALVNFKALEVSFGEIQILDGRETDVLVLQEDRISYVLAGKNLLSDAAAGGAITSVPEVLGTQIARTEKYGISFNPESYVNWGSDRFFTDSKRGAVIQLRGDAYSNEQMQVISEANMRTWFRDEFINTPNMQKLGGWDPFMNEYVLTFNDIELPSTPVCAKCGRTRTLTFAQGEEVTDIYEFCTNLGITIGDVVVDYQVVSIDVGSEFIVDVTYDGVTHTSGIVDTSGQVTFFKNTQAPENVDVKLTVTGNAVISVTVQCPFEEAMTLIEVVLTDNNDATLATMKQFNYVNGMYVSPTQSNFFIFASGTGNPLVSYYLATAGFEGQGPIPVEGSVMSLKINENYPWVSFNFDPAVNKFRYLRSLNLYGNNNVDMQAMLALSTEATPIYNPSAGIYAADFIVPPSANGEYLYIIWDLRKSFPAQLCHAEALFDVCCDCAPCEELCSFYTFTNPITNESASLVLFPEGLCGSPEATEQNILPGETYSFCLPNVKDNYIVSSGNPIIYMESCDCPS